MYREDALKLTSDVLPRFGEMQITKIDYHAVDAFIDEMKVERDLSQSTLKKYVVLIRKVMKEAERDGVLNHIPTLPIVKREENPRPWFTPNEYQRLGTVSHPRIHRRSRECVECPLHGVCSGSYLPQTPVHR
jgi:hypothetical protein